jgi:hypothetical protein
MRKKWYDMQYQTNHFRYPEFQRILALPADNERIREVLHLIESGECIWVDSEGGKAWNE